MKWNLMEQRKNKRRNTSIWVLTSFVFLTSFRFMSSFAFLNFFVGLTSLDFELFWCLMLFVLFCCLTSLVLCTISKKCVRLLTFFYWNFFVPFYFCFQVHSVFMFCVFMELFQILLWHWTSDRGWRRQGEERGPQEDRKGVVKAWRRP